MQRDEFWPGARQGLTQRESEILSCMVNGLSNRGIANKLVLLQGTVDSADTVPTQASYTVFEMLSADLNNALDWLLTKAGFHRPP